MGFLLLMWVGMGNAVEAPSEILIGATLPLSGRFTPMAGTFDRLCHSWAKLVNAQGGLYVKAYDKKLRQELAPPPAEPDFLDLPTAIANSERYTTNDMPFDLAG